jgi:hypothetical protein
MPSFPVPLSSWIDKQVMFLSLQLFLQLGNELSTLISSGDMFCSLDVLLLSLLQMFS